MMDYRKNDVTGYNSLSQTAIWKRHVSILLIEVKSDSS